MKNTVQKLLPLMGLLSLLWLGLALSGCGDKPEEAYKRIVFNAKMGNEAAFVDGFTKDSQRLVKTLLALRRTYGDLVRADADPYLAIVMEEVEDVEKTEEEMLGPDGIEKVERKVATLTVTDGKTHRKIRMIEMDEGWKIDALGLQKLWADDRNTFKATD